MKTKVPELYKNIRFIIDNKEEIVNSWTEILDVQEILNKHDIDITFFQTRYALPVLNYFISVIKEENQIGNCPVIINLINYFKEKNISSSELFIICINFRNSLIKKTFHFNLLDEQLYEDISYIFDNNFRGVLQIFNDTVATAKEESQKFYEISIRDHLTNLYNRKMFDEMIDKEIQNTKRNKTTFSLILFDIDHFKKVNDEYGHNIGDKVLIELSNLVKNSVRDIDSIARWGGEEFIILMTETNIKDAVVKAKKICTRIENHSFNTVGKLTCSFGVSMYEINDTALSIFQKVDKALYTSKENGRNQVTTE